MKRIMEICLIAVSVMLCVGIQLAGAEIDPEIDSILMGIESKYRNTTFTANFHQTSTLKAMELTDTATGKIYIKSPGAMRWEYEAPDPQTVITNGKKLWVYRPQDQQVMVGKAPTFFGDGKGAGFLSDIGQIRNYFSISKIESKVPDTWGLKLIPKEKRPDLSEVRLNIDSKSFEISDVTTYNSYGDETRIVFSDGMFGKELSPELFTFSIPPGADVVQIDE